MTPLEPAIKFKNSSEARDETSRPLVSVTVPTYNNRRTIEQCLESLTSQGYSPLEVIVIDDGSTDETSELVKGWAQSFANVHLIRIAHSGPSHARNVGIQESRGSILLFADADAIYSNSYVKKGVELLLEDPQMGAVCITGTIWIQKNTFVSRGLALEFEMKQEFLRSGKWRPYFAYLYSRDALQRVGGFDENLFQGEDKDIFGRVKAAGYHIGLVRGFNWFHLYPQDVRSLLSRSYRGGKQRVVFVAKNKQYMEIARRTVGLWVFVTLLAVSPLVPQSLLACALILVLGYSYKLLYSLQRGWGKGRLSDILLLPLVSAIRYLTTAAGYSKGSAVYLLRRVRRLDTKWSDV